MTPPKPPIQEQQDFSMDYQHVHWSFFVGIGILIGFILGLLVANAEQNPLTEFFNGINPEAIAPETMGILFTIVVLDRLNAWRQRDARKNALIQQMGSRSNDFVLEAIRLLNIEGWLSDRSVRNVRFKQVNYEGAEFSGAIFQNISFTYCDFSKQTWMHTKFLMETSFWGCKFSSFIIMYSDFSTVRIFPHPQIKLDTFQNMYMKTVDFSQAHFGAITFENTVLDEVNFENAYFGGVVFRKCTILGCNFANIHGSTSNLTIMFEDCNLRGCNFSNPENPNINIQIKGKVISPLSITDDHQSAFTLGETSDFTQFTNPNHIDFTVT